MKLEHYRYNISLKFAQYVIILRPFIFTENGGCHSKGGSGHIQKIIKNANNLLKSGLKFLL